MPTFKATECRVNTRSITIFFSEKLDQDTATDVGHYIVFAPNSGLNKPQTPLPNTWTASMPDDTAVALSAPPGVVFDPGDHVRITVNGVQSFGGKSTITNQKISEFEPGASDPKRITRDVEDAISYPVLTEEVAYRPSPVGIPATGAGGITGPGSANLGQVALQAVTDVLGWKANASDPKGFVGALTQSFTLTDVEGHVESTWTPRTYAVQTDLGGGITGAQASLYMRAKDALEKSLPLLDGLYPLDPEADPEYVKALREMARSQMTEIVKELGVVGLPSILRINTYFKILLDRETADLNSTRVVFDPDKVEGTLGELRDEYGIYFLGNTFNNSVEDEQDITNFRVISDYMTSLRQSWIENRDFFTVARKAPAFFGTQLVLISRQFNVITETVNELRFSLDSVFIGPNERQTLLLEFEDKSQLPPMFLEDVLEEIESFVGNEGPRLLRDGGRISVTNNILPVSKSLKKLVEEARNPRNSKQLPDGFRTARVRHSLDDLRDQLGTLIRLIQQVEQQVPTPEGKPVINNVSIKPDDTTKGNLIAVITGEQFDSAVTVEINSTTATAIKAKVAPGTSQEIQASFPSKDLSVGSHSVVVTNPDGQSSTYDDAFTWNGASAGAPLFRKFMASTAKPGRKRRRLELTVNQQPVPGSGQGSIAHDLKKELDELRKNNNDVKTLIEGRLTAIEDAINAIKKP